METLLKIRGSAESVAQITRPILALVASDLAGSELSKRAGRVSFFVCHISYRDGGLVTCWWQKVSASIVNQRLSKMMA